MSWREGERGFAIDGPPVDPQQDDRLTAELGSDEHVIWADRPLPGRLPSGFLLWRAFGGVFAGFATLFITIGAIAVLTGGTQNPQSPQNAHGGSFFLFLLIPVIHLVLGIAIVLVPSYMKKRWARALYALTNKRVIVWTPELTSYAVVSFGPEKIAQHVKRKQRSDGSGDLLFDDQSVLSFNSFSGFPGFATPKGIIGIRDVANAERLIRETLV